MTTSRLWALAPALLLPLPALAAGDEAPARPAPQASEGTFLAKPYLQIGRTPTPDSLRLLWHAPDVDAPWSVELRNGPDAPWRTAEAPAFRRVAVAGTEPHRIYGATLSGLTPGGTFQYRVLKGPDLAFSADARAPKTADQPYRFVAFADCGAGTPEQKPLARRAILSNPDLVVIPGDIVYDVGLISDYRTKFWPVYNADATTEAGAPLLRSVPFVAAPGNHDTATRDLDRYPDGLAYYLVWDQPLNGPLGPEGGPFVPRAEGHRRQPPRLRRGRRAGLSPDDQLLLQLRQCPLDHPGRQPLR